MNLLALNLSYISEISEFLQNYPYIAAFFVGLMLKIIPNLPDKKAEKFNQEKINLDRERNELLKRSLQLKELYRDSIFYSLNIAFLATMLSLSIDSLSNFQHHSLMQTSIIATGTFIAAKLDFDERKISKLTSKN